jgi:hypothetical protein
VIVALLRFSYLQLQRVPITDVGKQTGGGNPKGEGKVVESPLNIVFSLAILIWAAIVTCYHTDAKPKTEGSAAVTPTPAVGQKVSYEMLPSISGFAPYHPEVPNASDRRAVRLPR